MTDTEKPTVIRTSTKGEGHFWLAVFECCESPPKIDFDKLAEKCNYKNAATARVTFNNKRKALRDAELALGAGSDTAAAAPPVSPKRGRKPRPKADGEGGEEAGEPVKKRGRGRPKKVVAQEEHNTTEDENASN